MIYSKYKNWTDKEKGLRCEYFLTTDKNLHKYYHGVYENND